MVYKVSIVKRMVLSSLRRLQNIPMRFSLNIHLLVYLRIEQDHSWISEASLIQFALRVGILSLDIAQGCPNRHQSGY